MRHFELWSVGYDGKHSWPLLVRLEKMPRRTSTKEIWRIKISSQWIFFIKQMCRAFCAVFCDTVSNVRCCVCGRCIDKWMMCSWPLRLGFVVTRDWKPNGWEEFRLNASISVLLCVVPRLCTTVCTFYITDRYIRSDWKSCGNEERCLQNLTKNPLLMPLNQQR